MLLKYQVITFKKQLVFKHINLRYLSKVFGPVRELFPVVHELLLWDSRAQAQLVGELLHQTLIA